MSEVTYSGLAVLPKSAGIETRKLFANNINVTGLVEAASGKFAKMSGDTASYASVVATTLNAKTIKAATGEDAINFDKLVAGPGAEFTSTLTLQTNEELGDLTVTRNGIYFRDSDGVPIGFFGAKEPGVGEVRPTLSFQGYNTNTEAWEEMGFFA